MPAKPTDVDVVFLLPGFLGFEQFNQFAYFGDRFGTGLRASLSPRIDPLLQVVAIALPPTSSLAERQLALGKTLVSRARAVCEKRGVKEVRAVHLVGHSTGGVDAHLLTLERSLTGRPWNDFDGTDVTWLRDRVRSVVSIASPHHGTCLAVDPLAKLFAGDSPAEFLRRIPDAADEAVSAALQIMRALPVLAHDYDLHALLTNVVGSADAWKFLGNILRGRALIEDLAPAAAVARNGALGRPPPGVLRRSYVTIAGITPDATRNVMQSVRSEPSKPDALPFEAEIAPPDPLFLLLAQLSSGRATECFARAPLPPGALAAVQAGRNDPSRVIAQAPELLPATFDAAVNDGVVNTARQLIDPNDPDELAAIVVADHFDVVGHYDRAMFTTDPKTGEIRLEHKISGLLHSGSRFRDDQFFDLIEHLAATLLPAFA